MQLPDREQYTTKEALCRGDRRILLHMPRRGAQDSLAAGRKTVRMLDLQISEIFSQETGKYGRFVKNDCLNCETCTKTNEKF